LAAPRVAVIIPSYNTAKYIAETLDSVFAQTYKNYEPIVVNDGSPDTPELEKVLAPYMSRIRYLTRPNGGLAAARNTGIRSADTELIALLDSDDIWEPDYLENQVSFLLANPQFDLVYGDATFFGSELSGRRFMELNDSNGQVTFRSLICRECNVMVSVLVRRECLVEANLFDEKLRRCEDFDMWGRFLKAGFKIGYHRKVLMKYRRHSSSLSADAVGMMQSLIQVFEKFRAELQLTSEETETLERQLQHAEAEKLFYQGKSAFLTGDFATASRNLLSAHGIVANRRLWVIAQLIQICPRLLQRLYVSRYPATL
jgi:glycosyltransferase involved in cell wall biosynthesis